MIKKIILAGMLAFLCLGLSAGAPATAQVALNDQSLEKMLSDIGYQPKKLSQSFLIVAKQDKWTISIGVGLSPDHTKIGLNANLGTVANEQAVNAAQWKALLVANADIDPSNFSYQAKLKRLVLHRSFDNRAVTAATLKLEIDSFIRNLRSTEAVWGGVVP